MAGIRIDTKTKQILSCIEAGESKGKMIEKTGLTKQVIYLRLKGLIKEGYITKSSGYNRTTKQLPSVEIAEPSIAEVAEA